MDNLNPGLSSLVRFGVSDQLIQDLQVIEESCDFYGKALYDQATIYEMRCAILCRNFAKALWEYSHYIALIEHEYEYGVIDFFWEKNVVSSPRFKAWLESSSESSVYLSEDKGVIKALIGKREFAFNPKRINLMAAWTAFLVMVEPQLLEKLVRFKRELNEVDIDAFSKHLKASCDHYLEPHLQALHQQRQGRALLSWLQEHSVNHQETLLQDDSVLSFWTANAALEEGDFKRFSSVADCAYRLHHAIELGEDQRELESARSYHQDKGGEDASWLLDEASQIEGSECLFENMMIKEHAKAVESLSQTPLNEIKFLTNKDADFCGKFEHAGSALSHLPLTFLRAQVFGLQQAKLTEDMRATKGQNLQTLINMEGFSGYKAWNESLNEQIDKIAQTRLAIAYILLQHKHPVAFARLLDTLTEEQRSSLQDSLGNQTTAMLAKQIIIQLEALAPFEIKRLEKAFTKVNRSGFKMIPETAQLYKYLLGDECLSKLESLLSHYSKVLASRVEQLSDFEYLETADVYIFSQTFSKLYGEQGAYA